MREGEEGREGGRKEKRETKIKDRLIDRKDR